MATTLDLVRQIKERNITGANKTFAELMAKKRQAVESAAYSEFTKTLFKKNS